VASARFGSSWADTRRPARTLDRRRALRSHRRLLCTRYAPRRVTAYRQRGGGGAHGSDGWSRRSRGRSASRASCRASSPARGEARRSARPASHRLRPAVGIGAPAPSC